ncbi:NAD+ synthase [Legionella fairfieldensis]|uniref:NAD+ synthase n=1 Tax=Legionella fairfieldensis TaxID=45064 RepID=UPI00049090BE|nr:NAD+ synthase [Legionella fairfieldensis]
MQQPLAILMAQINPVVGAIEANAEKIVSIIQREQQRHELILFPELVLTGYPPEDLLFRKALYDRVENALQKIKESTEDCYVIVGHPCFEKGNCFNAASVIHRGKQIAVYRKQKLPNYGVFDEYRYFKPGPAETCILDIKGYRLGLCICEDVWQTGPVEQIANAGAEVMLCINASPFDYDKPNQRLQLLKTHARHGMAVIYVNQFGGQDELVFDGQSFALNNQGTLCAQAPAFREQLQTVILEGDQLTSELAPLLDSEQLLYEALVCGTRDYIEKNGFPGVLIGLSGGIDSALTLAIAADALGPSRVHAVMMPSRYTAEISLLDAQEQLAKLGIKNTLLSIEPAFNALLETLAPSFKNLKPDTTEENLQARIRGMLLMALSNKTGQMVLTTSNKSETAVGYTTLYGDMAGGFAVLKDVLKTQVYALARYRNRLTPVIPERVLTRPPSAELAENQTDQDTLPDYDVLDAIIKEYMENNQDSSDIIQKGYCPDDVNQVIRLIKRNEYKRHQAQPGVKISPCSFGRDWRYPITSGF